LGAKHIYSGSYLELLQGRYTSAYQIDSVLIERNLERHAGRGGTYDLGRLGSEIACVVAGKNLGLKDIIIEEPA